MAVKFFVVLAVCSFLALGLGEAKHLAKRNAAPACAASGQSCAAEACCSGTCDSQNVCQDSSNLGRIASNVVTTGVHVADSVNDQVTAVACQVTPALCKVTGAVTGGVKGLLHKVTGTSG